MLNVTYKILFDCIVDSIKPWVERTLGDYQAGFRKTRSTIDQIFILRQLLQKTWEYNKSIHMLFTDYKKAYTRNSIDRASLIRTLEEFEMLRKLINLIECSIRHTEVRVKIGRMLSKSVQVTTGLRQGDAVSPKTGE